jgi:FO synthase
VARLALHPLITNIQVSWVKLGPEGAALALRAGANDLGGVLMDESITRAAGGANGQELSAAALERLARGIGRQPWQRTTLYRPVTRPTAQACDAASDYGPRSDQRRVVTALVSR